MPTNVNANIMKRLFMVILLLAVAGHGVEAKKPAREDSKVKNIIYMIGDATPGGWSWDNVTEMSKNPNDPNEFVYEGPLSEGEIKFPLEIDHSWGGDFILAPTANCAPSENGSYVIGNQPDNKWKISEAGNYRIVINAFNETISFIKQ